MKLEMKLTKFISLIQKVTPTLQYENFFRGHSDHSYNLVPSIYRDGLIENEDKIFNDAIVKTPYEFQNHKTTCEKLVKMQHYGIPTRLLDITTNPLVALYFACNGDKKKDGQVIFFQIPEDHIKYYGSDTVSILSNIAKMKSNFECDFSSTKISAFNKNISLGYLFHEIRDEKSYFQEIINPKHMEDVFVVKAKLDNARILNQQGLFLLFGIRSNKLNPATVSHKWKLNDKIPGKLIIPYKDKADILKQLSDVGINNSMLFPEIESQAKHLIELYKQK